MSKTLRNGPLVLAAAALIAAPANADPLPLNVPTNPSSPSEQVATPPAPPAHTAPTPAPANAAGAGASAQAHAPPAELRGPASPLPDQLTLAVPPAPPPPPPPPPPAPPPPPPAAPPPPLPPPPARMDPAPTAAVRVGLTDTYTRLSFEFAGPTTVSDAQQGDRLDLRFSRAADMDLAEVRASPPRYVTAIRRVSASGQPLRLALSLAAGVRVRHFEDGSRVIVDLLAPDGAQTTTNPDGSQVAVPARAAVTGTATVQLVEEADDTRVTVHWPAATRAAAFRRGEAVWLLFDATGRIDLRGVQRAGRRHQDLSVVQGEGVIGLRIPAAPDVEVSATASGTDWTIVLGAHADAGTPAQVRREVNADGRGRLVANFGRDGVVRWINDPGVGDRFAVGLVGGPTEGVDVRRSTVEAEILPSAQGAVIEPRADGVTAAFDTNGQLIVTRGDGLLAQAPDAATTSSTQSANAAALQAALANPNGVDATQQMSNLQIRRRLDDLQRRAAAEGVMEGAPVDARMALARFLLDNDFAPEALGALKQVSINQDELVELNPQFRLMRGQANVMLNRTQEALTDLNSPALANDPSAALWRGYAAFEKQDWTTAASELNKGVGAMELLPPSWRARFELALAEAELNLNDLASADEAASAAMGQATDQGLRLRARLVQARIIEARGDNDHALPVLDELSHTRDEEVAVRSTLEAVRVRLATNKMRPLDAVEPLEALRFRWRGDSLELSIVSTLGEVYSELGRWRDALATMRVAADRFDSDPASRQLRDDMSTLFERLFLDGEADQLEPIQALGLFYEFSELTPVGPNGDRMVRLLAGRLVKVDLLEQAAQLLQHQVDERLQGIGKAQVAADLAAIYLMDDKPDQALVTIDTTRQPNMPQSLLVERRIIEARALLDLGRLDSATELVERDHSEDAQRVRAEAAWRAHDWVRAAAELNTLIGMRDHSRPMDASDRQVVLRTAIALTLAGDDPGVRALYRAHAGEMAGTDDADSFEVVASGVSADGSAIRDVARAVARTDLLDRFMQHIKDEMTAEASEAAAHPPENPDPNAPPAPDPSAPPVAAAPPPGQAQRQSPAAAASPSA